MNERIKELADKIWAEEYWDNPNTDKLLPAQLKKFAELIVKECINEIHDADVGNLKGRGYYLDKVAEHIEKHFGVE
jgi:hypothetical protein